MLKYFYACILYEQSYYIMSNGHCKKALRFAELLPDIMRKWLCTFTFL